MQSLTAGQICTLSSLPRCVLIEQTPLRQSVGQIVLWQSELMLENPVTRHTISADREKENMCI